MAESTDMTCKELVTIVTDFLENSLPVGERQRFEAHLEDCEGCRRYLQQMRTTIRIAGTLTEENIAPVARAELLQLFRDWNRT